MNSCVYFYFNALLFPYKMFDQNKVNGQSKEQSAGRLSLTIIFLPSGTIVQQQSILAALTY